MDMQVKLTQFSHGGGCGCKIAPGVLEQILSKGAPGILPKELLVGIETSDDAAVYQINERQAIVATTDFFMPIVDDPFDFGAIAATNAISDVYAMGGQPLFALALVGMPVNQIPLDVIRKILQGGESVCAPPAFRSPAATPSTRSSPSMVSWRSASSIRATSSATPVPDPETSSSSASPSAWESTAPH
jgi:selenophosphate synthase